MILDLNRNTISGRRPAKPDLGVANRELKRVMQQIANRCRQHLRVGNNLDVLNDGRDPES